MKILLTGSNGFLGNILYKNLKPKHLIKTTSRSNSDYNFDLVNTIPDFNENFDLIIHAAGKAHVISKSLSNFNDFYKVNVIGTQNLLKGLEKSGLPKMFVFISSVSVYGLYRGDLINEDSDLLANDAYGRSKIQAEFIVKKWCLKHNIIFTILRLPLLIAENPPGNLKMMITAIKKGYYFNINGGTSKKSMVLVSDVARYITLAAEKGGVFNLTDSYHPNLHELSFHIANQIGIKKIPNMPLLLAQFLAKIGDILGDKFPLNSNKLLKLTSTLTFDDNKAKICFGWNPTLVLNDFNLNNNIKFVET